MERSFTWDEFLVMPHDQQVTEGMAALAEVVAEKGEDYWTPDLCVYEDRGEPGCFIGNAAYKLGAPLDLLRKWDTLKNSGWGTLVKDLGYEAVMAPDLIEAWRRAQAVADSNDPWGEALRAAQEMFASNVEN